MESISPPFWYFIIGGVASFITFLSFVLAFWKIITKDKVRDIIREEIEEFLNKEFTAIKNRTYQNSDDIRTAQNVQMTNSHNIEMLDSNLNNLQKIVEGHYELHSKSFDKIDNRLEAIDSHLRQFLRQMSSHNHE